MTEETQGKTTRFRCLACGRVLAYVRPENRFEWVYASWDTRDGNEATRCPGCGRVRIRHKQRAPP